MYDKDYDSAAEEWLHKCDAWRDGNHPDCAEYKADYRYYWDWSGNPPERGYYRPVWTEEPTHYMMYENTTEGTPISPAFATPEELAQWLVDNGASAFGGETASYKGWLATVRGGYAPSAILDSVNGLRPGMDFAAEDKPGRITQ
jgi:hypothetical protein